MIALSIITLLIWIAAAVVVRWAIIESKKREKEVKGTGDNNSIKRRLRRYVQGSNQY